MVPVNNVVYHLSLGVVLASSTETEHSQSTH